MKKKDIKFLKEFTTRIYDQNPKMFDKKENHYNKFHNKKGKVVNIEKTPTGTIETKSKPGYVKRLYNPFNTLYKKFAAAWEQLPPKERSHDFDEMLPKLILKIQEMGVKLS